MASPHVAGAAALIKSVQPDWGPSQLASTIEMTATTELARDENGDPATTEQVGAGRPQLGLAAQAGLYLDVTGAEFELANPVRGGSPRTLNLPGVVDASCKGACSFSRTVTDLMGGGSWTATPVDFPPGTQVTVSPPNFTLANRASRELLVTVNAGSSGVVGDWVSGRIRLSAAGSPDLYLTVSVYSYGGDLPENWPVVTSEDSGWTTFGLNDLVALPNASFQAGGPVQVGDRLTHLDAEAANEGSGSALEHDDVVAERPRGRGDLEADEARTDDRDPSATRGDLVTQRQRIVE